jgi:hypothetical protein
MELATISPGLMTLSMLLIVFPVTFVFRAVRVHVNAIAVGLVIFPVA